MTPQETNELINLLAEAGVQTTGDLLDKLSPDTIQAVRSDLIASQPLTEEEQAFFDAEHDLSAALTRASQSARLALDSQTAADLSTASTRFAVAADAAKALAQAETRMAAAFRQSAEYAAQVEAQL